MNLDAFQKNIKKFFFEYRIHLFVFLLTVFIALTIAHPAVLLNDEFITTNQLHQLQAGHQIVVNEGKYGLAENGSMSGYFGYRSNVLGYSLFLPLISLPSYWMIEITGENFVYFILILWTLISLFLILFINHFFMEFSTIYSRKWAPAAYIAVFILFFINLFFYSGFPVDPVSNYPEILAIVFTNIILLGISAVLIYEINYAIFKVPAYSFFGTIVCLFSSSYIFWVTHCKDHILVLPIFSAIFLCLVYHITTNDYWYLPLSFLLCGILAWVRPELALWISLLVIIVLCFTLVRHLRLHTHKQSIVLLCCSPLFVFIGALPFFLNNYLVTKNIFLPVQSLYLSENTTTTIMHQPNSSIRVAGVKSFESVIGMFLPSIPGSPVDFFRDILEIFFLPQNGSISVLAVVPLFFTMGIVAGILLLLKKISITLEERRIIFLAFGISAVVFLTYIGQAHLLNTDKGIIPDIRYLTPLYLPLTIIGLILLHSFEIFRRDMKYVVRYLFLIAILGTCFILVVTPLAYSGIVYSENGVILPIGKFFSLYTITIVILTLISLILGFYLKKGYPIMTYLVLLLCSLPFFWQISIILFYLTFSGFAGHILWIPIARVIWQIILSIYAIAFK